MKLKGKMKFLGIETRCGFKDPTRSFTIAGFCEGLDTLRVYLNDDLQIRDLSSLPLFCDLDVVFDYNPVSKNICLVSVSCLK